MLYVCANRGSRIPAREKKNLAIMRRAAMAKTFVSVKKICHSYPKMESVLLPARAPLTGEKISLQIN